MVAFVYSTGVSIEREEVFGHWLPFVSRTSFYMGSYHVTWHYMTLHYAAQHVSGFDPLSCRKEGMDSNISKVCHTL